MSLPEASYNLLQRETNYDLMLSGEEANENRTKNTTESPPKAFSYWANVPLSSTPLHWEALGAPLS